MANTSANYWTTPVPAPVVGPAPVGSLLRTAIIDETSDGEWCRGWGYLPMGENLGSASDQLNIAGFTAIAMTDPSKQVKNIPVVLLYGEKFSAHAAAGTDFHERIIAELEAATSTLLEQEFANGTIAQAQTFPNQYLRSTCELVATKAMGPREAVARLEQALSPTWGTALGVGQSGAIHMTVEAAELYLSTAVVDVADGGRIRTRLGTPIVAGQGYTGAAPASFTQGAGSPITPPGTTPTAATVDLTWAYATDPVHVRLGDIHLVPDSPLPDNIGGLLDRTIDREAIFAWRYASASWDGHRHYCVLVDHTGDLHSITAAEAASGA